MNSTLQRSTLTNQVYNLLHDAIIEQDNPAFLMGERINEKEIAKMLGCSTTPVREAMNLLQHEGLVMGDNYKSSRVACFTLGDIDNLLGIRNVLEVYALRQAFELIDDDLIAKLENNLTEYTSLYSQGEESFSFSKIDNCNRRFHFMLTEKLGNSVLNDMISSVISRLAVIRAPVVRDRRSSSVNSGDLPPPTLPFTQRPIALL
jgi:DNA-binding GntR family transcriptional regulator